MHNGFPATGPANGNWKGGHRSRLLQALPTQLMTEAALDVVNNPARIELTEHLGVLNAMLIDSLGRWDTGSGKLFRQIRDEWERFTAQIKRGPRADQAVLTQCTTNIARMLDEGVADQTARDESRSIIQDIRRVSETERKRLIDAQQMMSNDAVAVLMAEVIRATLEEVTDPHTQGRLHARYSALLGLYRAQKPSASLADG